MAEFKEVAPTDEQLNATFVDPSPFTNGAEVTITGAKVCAYEVDGKPSKNAHVALVFDVGNLNVNRFRKGKAVYDGDKKLVSVKVQGTLAEKVLSLLKEFPAGTPRTNNNVASFLNEKIRRWQKKICVCETQIFFRNGERGFYEADVLTTINFK